MRTGSQFLASLGDGRDIRVDGVHVSDPGRNATIAPAAGTLASLLDLAAAEDADVGLLTSLNGHPVPLWNEAPTTREQVAAWGVMLTRLAEASASLVARGWDSSGSYVAGLSNVAGAIERERSGLEETVAGMVARARRGTLVALALANRGADGEKRGTRMVARDRKGIRVSGRKPICTGAVYSDEILVLTPGPFRETPDPDSVLGFVVQARTPGLRISCRSDAAAPPPPGMNAEIDCCLDFEDVFVPWERVLYAGELSVAGAVWGTIQLWDKQCLARRLVTRLAILHGLALALRGGSGPIVPGSPAYLAARAHATVAALVAAAEASPVLAPGLKGGLVPDPPTVLLAIDHAIDLIPRLQDEITLLGGQRLVNPLDAGGAGADCAALAAWLLGSRAALRQRLLDCLTVGGRDALATQLAHSFDSRSATALVEQWTRGAARLATPLIDERPATLQEGGALA